MAVFLGFLLAVLTTGAIVLTIFSFRSFSSRGRVVVSANKARGFTALGFSLAFFAAFVTIPFGIKTIDAGEVGVVKVFGEAKESVGAGMHFINVFTSEINIYDAKVQQLEIRTEVYTKDAQPCDVQLVVQFKIDQGKAVDIAKTFGSLELLQSRVQNISVEKAKVVVSDKTAMAIIETRKDLSPDVQKSITQIQDQYFIKVESVVITDIAFSEAFEKAVEEKMIAEQKKLEAEYAMEQAIIKAKEQADVARIKAEADLVVARLDAEKMLAEAGGKANAEIAIAEGAAKALKIKYVEIARMLGLPVLEKEITDGTGNITAYEYTIDASKADADQYKLLEDYMRYINYLETWDGKLPQVIGDGSSIGGIIIQP